MSIVVIIAGIIIGVLWERYVTAPSKSRERPTLFPSLVFHVAGKALHIHHWIYYLLGSVSISVWAISTDRFLYPSVLLVNAFFIASIAYNFKKYRDWYRFWY